MHIGIFTYGSRGDVQPFIAVALGFTEKGYKVTLAANENFRDFVEGYGLLFHPLPGNIQEILYAPEGQRLVKSGNIIQYLRYMARIEHNLRITLQESIFSGAQQVDVLVTNDILATKLSVVAEKLNKPWVVLYLTPPIFPTKKFPAIDLGYLNFSRVNYFTYKLIHYVFWNLHKKDYHEFRKDMGLPPSGKSIYRIIEDTQILFLNCYSPLLIEQPQDWPLHHHTTGFLEIAPKYKESHQQDQIPGGLNEWLISGKPPVYICFGSIPIPDPTRFRLMLTDLLKTTDHRFVFCEGWSELPDLPRDNNLFVVKSINYDWLLPRCKAAIIHGGIGTLAAMLKAGIPAIVLSIFGDQSVWGKIIEQKMLGAHIPFKKITTEKLISMLNAISEEKIKQNLAKISCCLRKENGVQNAIHKIEDHLGLHPEGFRVDYG